MAEKGPSIRDLSTTSLCRSFKGGVLEYHYLDPNGSIVQQTVHGNITTVRMTPRLIGVASTWRVKGRKSQDEKVAWDKPEFTSPAGRAHIAKIGLEKLSVEEAVANPNLSGPTANWF